MEKVMGFKEYRLLDLAPRQELDKLVEERLMMEFQSGAGVPYGLREVAKFFGTKVSIVHFIYYRSALLLDFIEKRTQQKRLGLVNTYNERRHGKRK
jgi:hypothetical protein